MTVVKHVVEVNMLVQVFSPDDEKINHLYFGLLLQARPRNRFEPLPESVLLRGKVGTTSAYTKFFTFLPNLQNFLYSFLSKYCPLSYFSESLVMLLIYTTFSCSNIKCLLTELNSVLSGLKI